MMDFDAEKLQQVVSNLISNAFKFTGDGGNIYFSIRKENDKLVIRVKDTGRGIPAEDLEKVFDPFFTRKGVGEGNGLGLSISLGIMEQHGGSLDIVNNQDKGVTASMRLPVECCEVEHG